MEEKIGILRTFYFEKNYGFISVEVPDIVPGVAPHVAKFYLHRTRIKSGQPVVGSRVRFKVSALREGTYPAALEAEIETPGGVN